MYVKIYFTRENLRVHSVSANSPLMYEYGTTMFMQLGVKKICIFLTYMGADKSLARPGRKQAAAPEDFEFHISYL